MLCNKADALRRGQQSIIHESRLGQIRGTAGEVVVFHYESRRNKVDALRPTRLEGKEC